MLRYVQLLLIIIFVGLGAVNSRGSKFSNTETDREGKLRKFWLPFVPQIIKRVSSKQKIESQNSCWGLQKLFAVKRDGTSKQKKSVQYVGVGCFLYNNFLKMQYSSFLSRKMNDRSVKNEG